MYPSYSYARTSNLTEFQLHQDDKNAVRQLYGYEQQDSLCSAKPRKPSTTTSTTASTTVETTTIVNPSTLMIIPNVNITPPILCELNNLNTFLIVKDRLYIIFKKWFWMKKLNEKCFEPPALISDLPGLPKRFEQIDPVYLDRYGRINIFIENTIYSYSQKLKLLNTTIGSREGNFLTLLGAVNTNSGQTIVYYTNNLKKLVSVIYLKTYKFTHKI